MSKEIIDLKERIVVIGGGIAGITTALKLADEGHNITLFERNVIGSGSSGLIPGRAGLGFHYADRATAIHYLRNTLKFLRQCSPDFLRGNPALDYDPLRHGRYFILKASEPPAAKVLETYAAIREEYRKLLQEDPENAIFGPADNFFRVLDRSEYENLVNADLVETAVETNECIFRVPEYLAHLKQKILHHPRIQLFEYAEVISLENNAAYPQFTLVVDHAGTRKHYQTNTIINATWYNIEKLNAQLGIPYTPGTRTNRLKSIIQVALPPELEGAHSMFFCMGPIGAMYTNLGNGTGMVTCARVTNMEVCSDLDLSARAKKFLNNEASEEEKQTLARDILFGAAKYIPALAKAIIIEIRFGIVQTEGNIANLAALDDPNNPYHKRNYTGVRVYRFGKGGILVTPPGIQNDTGVRVYRFGEGKDGIVVIHPGMKFFYGEGAEEIAAMFQPKSIESVEVEQQYLPEHSSVHSSPGLRPAVPSKEDPSPMLRPSPPPLLSPSESSDSEHSSSGSNDSYIATRKRITPPQRNAPLLPDDPNNPSPFHQDALTYNNDAATTCRFDPRFYQREITITTVPDSTAKLKP